jgi:hypothetical protein
LLGQHAVTYMHWWLDSYSIDILYVYLNSRKQIFAERSTLGVYTNIRAILNSRRWLPKIINSRTPSRLKKIREITLNSLGNGFRKQPSLILHTFYYCNRCGTSQLFSTPGVKQYAIVQNKDIQFVLRTDYGKHNNVR